MSNALFSRLRQREQEQEAQRAAFRERTQELIRQRTTDEAVGSVGVVESMKPSSEVVNIARQRNMSVNFAHQNQSQILEAEKRQRTFEMLQNAPMLGEFLRDPNRAAAVQDSLDELAELERNLGVQITANQLLRAQSRLVSRDTQRRITNNNPAVEQHYAANLENDFSIVQGYAAQQAAQGERVFSGEATEDFKGAIGAFFAGTLPLAFKSLGETGRVGAEVAAERIEAGPDWMQDAILWQQIPIRVAQFGLKQSPIYQTDIGRQILDYELPTASEYLRTQEAIFGELEQAGEAAMEFLEPEELNFAQKVAGALGQIATQVVVSSLSPQAGAAMMASQGASQQISRMEAQDIDASSKPLAIAAGGATTYILENLRLNSIFKAMPSELKGAAATGFFSSLRRVGVQAGQEAVQEATENVIQNVIALFAYEPDAKIFEGAAEGARVGGTAAAIFQTFVELALPRRARTNLTEQEAQQLSDARKIVSAAAATRSNKDAVEEFINNANETQTVDIDAEGFQELYQSDPEGTKAMLQALGVSEQQMVEAMSGDSITLPAAKLLTMEDEAQFDQILDITRTSEGGMTPQEARREIEEGLGPELTEKLQQITEENIEQQRDETIARDVQTQLIAAGRSKQEAKAAGKIWSSAFASLEAMGVDSKAIYERLELRISDRTELEQAGIITDDPVITSSAQTLLDAYQDSENFEALAVKANNKFRLNELRTIYSLLYGEELSATTYKTKKSIKEQISKQRRREISIAANAGETVPPRELFTKLKTKKAAAVPKATKAVAVNEQVTPAAQKLLDTFLDSDNFISLLEKTNKKFKLNDLRDIHRQLFGLDPLGKTKKQITDEIDRRRRREIDVEDRGGAKREFDRKTLYTKVTPRKEIISKPAAKRKTKPAARPKARRAARVTRPVAATVPTAQELLDVFTDSEAFNKLVEQLEAAAKLREVKSIFQQLFNLEPQYKTKKAIINQLKRQRKRELDVLAFGGGRERWFRRAPYPDVDPAKILKQAAEEGYEGDDATDADAWLDAKESGLKLTKSARMQRAKEQGYNVNNVVYHGSPVKDIRAFRANIGDYGFGVYVTNNAGYADIYKRKNMRGKLTKNAITDYFAGVFSGKKYKLFIRGKGINSSEIDTVLQEAGYQIEENLFSDPQRRTLNKKIRNELMRLGYTHAIMDATKKQKKDGIILVFEPKNLRSTDAAFNPDYAESEQILAQTIVQEAQDQGYKGKQLEEAETWIRAREKGLALTDEARIDRADDMGFDTSRVLYHGTDVEFDAFIPSKTGAYGSGVYLSPRTARAQGYGSIMLKTYVRGDFAPQSLRSEYSDRILTSIPIEERKKLRLEDAQGFFERLQEQVNDELARDGYDGVDVGDEVLVFDPSNIRSVDAAFDPDYADTPTLLAQKTIEKFVQTKTQRGEPDGVEPERAGDGGGRLPSRRFARLEGAPTIRAATGPIPRIVEVADKYARDNGIPAGRQAQYAEVDEQRAERIAQAYEEMEHNPSDPAVQAAYNDLVSQTIAQYEALLNAGYQFYFIDINSDVGLEYAESPFNAMRELRADQRMGVFPTNEGFGTLDAAVDDNPLLATTKYQWPFGSPDGELRPVTANDLFRAVHDALGHGLEGAGFRARGEENAWQSHVRLYTGPAVGAMTSETRGQNSWLNYGPYGETNRTAKTEDTVFADQKTGLMPEWTWTEGRVPDMQPDPRSLFAQEGGTTRGTTRIMGELGSGSVLGTSPTIVKLLEAANQTTFLHESAHVFLEIYAALEQENAQVAEMMVPLREWLGWEVGQPLTVEMHEKFAGREEGFELYIKTGKAPSTALEKAFEAFRKWFNQIYQSVRGMANNLDPRAREFFDRMLATEEEIAEAQMKFHDSMTETVRDFMSPEQREKHRELQALAKKVATDKLFRKHLEQMQKSEKKEYKKDKKKISEQVRAEVSESSVFKAMSALADTESPVKLNRQATLDILGDERIVPIEPYLSEEGIDPELFAASFGYDTADQMFAEIAEDPDYDEIVEIEARRRMDDLQSDLLIDQESAQAEAIEASFNDAQVRKLKVELDAIAEKALKETIPLAAIRKRARDIIDTKPLNEIIKPGKYALQAMNLHKKAIKAAATQKWDDAFRLTQQAMLQHHLARYAFQARTEVEKGNRFLARFALHRKLDPKKIAPEFIQRIRAMMELPTASPERQAEIRADLRSFEEAQTENNFSVVLPSQVYADQDMTERRSMTLEQFREFRDAIKNLNKGGRLQSEQAKAIATKVSTEAADAIFASWGKRKLKQYSRTQTFADNIGKNLRVGDATIIRLPYLAAWLQGRKDKQPIGMVRGVIVDTLYNDLVVAQNARENRLNGLDDSLLEIFEKNKIRPSELNAKLNVPEMDTFKATTKNQLFALLLNMGTASNKQRVTDDVTLRGDAEQLLRMLEMRLDKKYFDAAQDIWDLINTQRNDLGAVHLRRTGVTPTWVESEQLVTKYGTYAGGYYPLRYDLNHPKNDQLAKRNEEDIFKQQAAGIAAKAETKSGMLKERLSNVKRPLELDVNGLIQHFAETSTFIEMSEAVDAAWSLANSNKFADALSQTWGSEYVETVKTILRRTASDAAPAAEFPQIEAGFRHARINASIAILGFNLPTALLAPASIWQTVMPRYGTKIFARGIIEFMKRGVTSVLDSSNTMERKSPFMRERARLINREAYDIGKRKVFRGEWNKAQAAGFVPMVQIEKYTVSGPLWWGVYKTSLMDGLSEQQSIAAADAAVASTQGSGRVIDQSVLQSTSSEPTKAIFTFMYGYVSGYYGTVRTDLALADTNIGRTMKLVKHLVVLNAIASTLETVIREGGFTDDEEEKFYERVLIRMARNTVLIPAVGGFASKYSTTTAVEDIFKKSRQSIEYLLKSYDYETGEIDGEQARKAAQKGGEAFGYALGIPGMTAANRIIDVYEEDDDPTIVEYLITGPDDDN